MNALPASTFIRLCLALAGFAVGSQTLAQPAPADAPAAPRHMGPDRGHEDSAKSDPEVAKQRLHRMIEQNKQRGARLEEALRALESGKDPMEVMREMVERGADRGRGIPPDGQPDGDGPSRPQGEGRGERGLAAHPQGEGGVERELGGLGNVLDMSGPARPLNDEEREKVKAVLRERLPRVAERFEQLAAQDPKMSQLLMDRVGARVQRAESIRKDDPEVADLRLKEIEIGSDAISLVRDWRKAKRASDPPALENAGADLRTAISGLFDVRVKLREFELRQVTQKLQKMQEDLNRFQAERDRVVERTFQQMTERGGPGQPGGPGRRSSKGEGKSAEGRQARPDGEHNPPPPAEPRP